MRANGRSGAYQATQVSTVSKSKLILLMYDGAIRFITEARRSVEKRDIAGRGVCIGKAQKIINELAGSLDHERGGEVAKSLDNVYAEINKNLTEANINGDASSLDGALAMLRTIKEAWEQVINESDKKPGDENGPEEPRRGPGLAVSC